jgi:hypothetical protein
LTSKSIFFGYISFSREMVDTARAILSNRKSDYLWMCLHPSRIAQDGPTEADPNLSFSIILDTDDRNETVSDIENVVRLLPFISCTLVVEDLSTREQIVHKWENLGAARAS